MENHQQHIEELLKNHPVFIFMKGSPDAPQCGFSALATNILKNLKIEFGSFDVLRDPAMRQGIKDYTGWPTIPQIFINSKFIGGSDILQELYQSGELQKMVKSS